VAAGEVDEMGVLDDSAIYAICFLKRIKIKYSNTKEF
jgi:hypothetical protein